MQESGVESDDYVRYLAEGSGNVSTDGFFSIQVRWPACLPVRCNPDWQRRPELRPPAGAQQSAGRLWAELPEPRWLRVQRVSRAS